MSILAQLQALQSEYQRQQKTGRQAADAYQELQPQYKERLTAAQQYQPKVSDAYTRFTETYNAAVGQYNQQLNERYQAYQNVNQGGSQIRSNYESALQTVQGLQSRVNERAAEKDRLYSSGQSQAYNQYVSGQYNPSVNELNQYINQTYNPALSSYQQFAAELQSAQQSYETLAADRGYADRAAMFQRAAYESTLSEYKQLQARYQELEPQLNEYTTQMQTAAEQMKAIEAQMPALQKSLAVERDPQKRETRVGYGRSLLTAGLKRAGSAR